LLLAGDVGGTKTNLAVFSPATGVRVPMAQARYPSEAFAGLDVMVREFLAKVKLQVEYACFDVAGPVTNGRARLTNLPWDVEEKTLARALHVRAVRLLNDLEAIAHAVSSLQADDLHTLNPGEPVSKAAIAVIAPGTGLGESFLVWTGSRYRAHPSEGGHADFAPTDPTQIELLRYLRRQFDRASVERVCSGIGIPDIYDYLQHSGSAAEDSGVAAGLAAASDRTRFIIETALDPQAPSPLCRATLDLFVTILGAEAGNLVLKVLATGGLYLAGGIPAHILPALAAGPFLQAFARKGRLADLLARVPVHVVINPRVALIGAASYGLEQARG
jgi:glucokinase